MNPYNIIIQGPVTFDGATLVAGGVKLSVNYCEFEDLSFSFTPQYGLLLLRDETKVEAQCLLKELAELPLADKVIKDVIRQACDKGFQLVQLELERYRQFVPTCEPKFYAEMDYGKQVDGRVVSLVTPEKTLRFYVSTDMRQVVSQLPVNAYRFCTTYLGFILTAERYKGLLGREKNFFEFVDELNRYTGYIRDDTCNICYQKYFENTRQAHELLGEIRSKVSGRECRDQLFQTLERNGYLEFSEGLFVRNGWSTYYVSNNGDVQRLCYNKKVEMREAILKAHTKGKLPTKLEEVTDNITLKRIAETVGKTRPELTLLILP